MSANCLKRPDPARVSVHGGHSGQFCCHARDHLEEIIIAYIDQEFSWVGITEHMPPVNDRFRYADEIERGLTANDLYHRFQDCFETCRRLKKKYETDIHIAVGFETEFYSGALPFIQELIGQFQPEYLVGSVHHVNDINFDFDKDHYARASTAAGSLDALYGRYFDIQHDLITSLRPAVVGHFDLIRLFDPDYPARLEKPAIKKKILRNLNAIAKLGLILDLNVRALYKGATEPYLSQSILREALRLGIAVVPGDDSHGVDTVGYGIKEGIELLCAMGFNTKWTLP